MIRMAGSVQALADHRAFFMVRVSNLQFPVVFASL